MKNLKIALTLIITLGASLLVVKHTKRPLQDSREQYEAYLRSHPYYKGDKVMENPGKKMGKAAQRRDRPNMRIRQEFLMTMNPALKRPTPEVLPQAMKMAAQARIAGTLPGEASAPWQERGPNNVGGRTRALMWDPNDPTGKKVWAGGVAGGLWFNNDITSETSSWQAVNDFWENMAVTSIAFDPNNSKIMYAGTGEGYFNLDAVRGLGIWKSTDGGATWSQLSASKDFGFVLDLAVRNENGTSVLYAGILGGSNNGKFFGSASQGLQRSADGGTTFRQVIKNLPEETNTSAVYGVADIEIGSDNRIWVGTNNNSYSSYNGAGGGAVLHSDDGITWTTAYQAQVAGYSGRVELALSSSNTKVAYALIESEGKVFEMKRTEDGGLNWTDIGMPDDDDQEIEPDDFTRVQAWYDLTSAVDPNNENIVIIGGINLHMTTDGGQTWKQISKWSNNPNMGNKLYSYVHADHHAIVFKKGVSNEVIFGNDGGVSWTNDLSKAPTTNVISTRNKGYNITQFYAAAIHPDSGKEYYLAGAQDNGTQRFQAAGINKTTEVSGGDGGFCFIDQTDGNHQITAYTNNNFYFSNDNWATDSKIDTDDTTGFFINPADYDDEQNILYSSATENSIARYFGSVDSYTRSDLTIPLVVKASHLKVSPHTRQSTTLFAGTAAGRVFKITDANKTSAIFKEITGANFPKGSVSCIETGEDENHLLVTFSNYGVVSVWYTADGGTTWEAKEGNLPDMPVRWALFNPTNYDEVILATELGIWGTKSISAATPGWSQFSNGLANVRIDMLQIRESDYQVAAATHGRGLFTSNVFSSQAPLKANFTARQRAIEAGGQVGFIDRSQKSTAWQWTFAGGTPATSTEQNPNVTYAANGSYTVTLTVKDAANNSANLAIADYIQVGPEIIIQPPLAPSGLVAKSTSPSEIQLTWNDNSDNETSFVVEKSTDGTTFEKLTETATDDATYIHTGLSTGSTFYYKVKAVNSKGDSEYSNIAQATTALEFFAIKESPSGLSGTATTSTTLSLNWKDNSSDETSFEVRRSTDGTQFQFAGSTSANVARFSDQRLKASTTYYYRVRGRNDNGTSDYSNIFKIITLDSLEAPSDLKAASVTSSQVKLSWKDNSSRETGFVIEKAVGAGTFIKLATVGANEATHTDTEVTELTAYKYQIYAINENTEVSKRIGILEVSIPIKQLPDITISSLNNPKSQSTEEITISANIRNLSDEPVESAFDLSFYLSTDNKSSASDELIGTVPISKISGKADTLISDNFDLQVLPAGDYFILAIADEDAVIEESDEDNNEKSSPITLTKVLSVADELRNSTKVYPNPVRSLLTVETALNDKEATALTITDLLGRILVRSPSVLIMNKIDFSDFPSGVYFITLQKQGGQFTQRIVKP